MTMSKNLSIEEEQVFWAELFAVMTRREERIRAAGQVDRELEPSKKVRPFLSCPRLPNQLPPDGPLGDRSLPPPPTIVRSQLARTLRSSAGYTISFRNGSIAAM